MMSNPKLVQVEPAPGEEIVLEGELRVGREDADILVDDPEASRHHAVLAHAGGSVTIRDLGSRNGTFVNGKPAVGEVKLAQGDVVKIASSAWRVELPQPATSAAPRPGRETAIADRADIEAARGAVPRPAPAASSAVAQRPALSAPAGDGGFAPPEGTAPAGRNDGRRRSSAARRLEATVVSYAVVSATAVAVVAYLATR
jgi:hypothetical protein